MNKYQDSILLTYYEEDNEMENLKEYCYSNLLSLFDFHEFVVHFIDKHGINKFITAIKVDFYERPILLRICDYPDLFNLIDLIRKNRELITIYITILNE